MNFIYHLIIAGDLDSLVRAPSDIFVKAVHSKECLEILKILLRKVTLPINYYSVNYAHTLCIYTLLIIACFEVFDSVR